MKHVVGVPGMKVSDRPGEVIITYALGSCLGITIHDAVAAVGGLLHVMLPHSGVAPQKAETTPEMFIDTGVPKLFRECYRLGARRERLVVKVAGGSASRSDAEADHFRIGARNFLVLERILSRNGIRIHAHDVGGYQSRTMALEIGSGLVTLKVEGKQFPL